MDLLPSPDATLRKVVDRVVAKAPLPPALEAVGFRGMVFAATDYALDNLPPADKWRAVIETYGELERLVDVIARDWLNRRISGSGDARVKEVAEMLQGVIGLVELQ